MRLDLQRRTLVVVSLWLATLAGGAVMGQAYTEETTAERDARMKWWREARFGMFIHWGVYSVPAGDVQGQALRPHRRMDHDRRRIPVAEYREYAKQFNPVKFDPEEWVQLAKDAGMKYIVITSKHHDGFAMFPSQATRWNIADASPYGRI